MTLQPYAYNPSIIRHRDRLWSIVRVHDRKDWRSNLYMVELDDSLRPLSSKFIRPPLSLTENSHEDARAFVYNGDLWMSWTCSMPNVATFRCVVVAGRLVRSEDNWSVEQYFIPRYGKYDWSGTEKNFVFFQRASKLYCWYGVFQGKQIVLELEGSNVTQVHTSPALPWPQGDIHGGAITPMPDGTLLHIFNSHTHGNNRMLHRYYIGAARLSGDPPFDMVSISRKPVLYGYEGVNLGGIKRFKPNVVYAGGAIWEGQKLLVSYGWNDIKSRIVKLNMEDLNL